MKSLVLLVIMGLSVTCRSHDIDLQTCIDNFDIHKDKIIRTQDSQNMGAKYLNEIDLGSREECLRLCCETDECDVFVFEEKNSGSCYLFRCGPPEDFKCKFTHHVNYSSAVLAVNRHLPDLESQIKLTKHEQDLSKLRKSESEPEVLPAMAETRAPLSTAAPTTRKPIVSTKPPEEARKCSRNQFECRSTSECIAIYNACDGIPQCADASDEAPELGCPGTATTAGPVRQNSPILPPRYDPNIAAQQLHPLPPVLPQEVYRPQGPQADFIRPQAAYEGQQMPPYGPVQGNWMPRPQLPQFADKNSHIFNHKENGLQVPDGQEISQVQYLDRGDPYSPKIPNYYDSYRQPIQPETWNPNPEEPQYNGYPPENLSSKNTWRPEPTKNEARKDDTKLPEHTFGTKVNPSHVQEKMAHELKNSKQGPSEQPTKIKIAKHKQSYPDVVAYKMDETSDLQDGAAQTASGAVLSLTLGLIITCVMALLIGCRLRVRRRIKKGGKSYAHDADYLVNGMYL